MTTFLDSLNRLAVFNETRSLVKTVEPTRKHLSTYIYCYMCAFRLNDSEKKSSTKTRLRQPERNNSRRDGELQRIGATAALAGLHLCTRDRHPSGRRMGPSRIHYVRKDDQVECKSIVFSPFFFLSLLLSLSLSSVS